jgi:hypothetical protein
MRINAGVKLVIFYNKSLKPEQLFIPEKVPEIFSVVGFAAVGKDVKKMVGVG